MLLLVSQSLVSILHNHLFTCLQSWYWSSSLPALCFDRQIHRTHGKLPLKRRHHYSTTTTARISIAADPVKKKTSLQVKSSKSHLLTFSSLQGVRWVHLLLSGSRILRLRACWRRRPDPRACRQRRPSPPAGHGIGGRTCSRPCPSLASASFRPSFTAPRRSCRRPPPSATRRTRRRTRRRPRPQPDTATGEARGFRPAQEAAASDPEAAAATGGGGAGVGGHGWRPRPDSAQGAVRDGRRRRRGRLRARRSRGGGRWNWKSARGIPPGGRRSATTFGRKSNAGRGGQRGGRRAGSTRFRFNALKPTIQGRWIGGRSVWKR